MNRTHRRHDKRYKSEDPFPYWRRDDLQLTNEGMNDSRFETDVATEMKKAKPKDELGLAFQDPGAAGMNRPVGVRG